MKGNFFTKMAWRNIQSNRQLYVPYILSSIITVAMFMMMASLMTNDFVLNRSATLPQLFGMGTVVIGLFSLIFIFYTNNFLMKRRKKELGLYSILGLEKKHVARVIGTETLIVSGASIIAGILIGILFGQLAFLFLNYLLQFPEAISYSFTLETVVLTTIVFAGIFILTLIYNIFQVTFANPIALLKGAKAGEKEPKSSPILFAIGLLTIGAGYWISLSIEYPINALMQFFTAVILVIIGTYLLFNAGSIIILKMLKKNKQFYYRPGPFISVSGMLYRMKQHATGLANISILSVMVIIAVSTTFTMFVGTEETLANRFPEENNVTLHTLDDVTGEELGEQIVQVQALISNKTKELGYEIERDITYRYVNLWGGIDGIQFTLKEVDGIDELPMQAVLIPLEDFNQAAEKDFTLEENEMLLISKEGVFDLEQMLIGDIAFDVIPVEDVPYFLDTDVTLVKTIVMVLPSVRKIEESIESLTVDTNTTPYWQSIMAWGTNAKAEEAEAYGKAIHQATLDTGLDVGIFYESRDANRQEWYSLNGGFLFLGIFLGSLFIIGSVLITYFKQVSEGYEDRERVQIMQKVGLDSDTTRKATRYQIIWMFILPLVVAVVHTAFAYPIIQKMLIIFGITNSQLLIACTVGVVVVYALIYWVIFRITSKVYLEIVE